MSRLSEFIRSLIGAPKQPAPVKPPKPVVTEARQELRHGPVYLALVSDANDARIEVVDTTTDPASYAFVANFRPGSDPLFRIRLGGVLREVPSTLLIALLDSVQEVPNE